MGDNKPEKIIDILKFIHGEGGGRVGLGWCSFVFKITESGVIFMQISRTFKPILHFSTCYADAWDSI